MTLGLVLSGGGVRGVAHIGVLKALHEANIKPAMVSGTSAGSIVAGLYAYGYSPEEIKICAKEITARYFDIDYPGILSSLVNLFFHGTPTISGLIKGDHLEYLFNKLTKGAYLKNAKIPVAITAVDINNAHIVTFCSHPLRTLLNNDYVYLYNYRFSEAIRASIAIPGIFKPKIINNMRLVDGGIRDNLPVDIIRLMGAKKVIAVNLGYSGTPVPGVDNIIEIALQSIDLMIYQITRPSLATADIIISPEIENVNYKDLSKIDYIVNCGYNATQEAMPMIKQMLSNYY